MSDEAKQATGAGRGVLYIAFAKFYFMFTGLVVQFRLPAILSHSAWGSYSFINSLVSPVNNVLVTGTIQTVSKFAAAEPEKARRVQQAAFRMHVRLGLLVSVAFIAAAPLVAWSFSDMSKMAPLMLAGLIVGGNAFYAVFVIYGFVAWVRASSRWRRSSVVRNVTSRTWVMPRSTAPVRSASKPGRSDTEAVIVFRTW